MCARYAATNKTGGDSYFFKYIGLILSIGAAVSFCLVILKMIDMGIDFTSGRLFIFVLADIGLILISFVFVASGLINKNFGLRFGTIALAALLLFINLFIESNLRVVDDWVGTVTAPRTTGAVEYSIIAQRSSNIELTKKNSVRAGIQNSDVLRDELEKEVNRLTDASFDGFDNLGEMVKAIEANNLDIAIVQSAILKVWAEYFPEEYTSLTVLKTFKAGTDKSASSVANVKIDITKPFIIYICGLDSEGDIDTMVARSDFNMLVCVDPERYKILMVSTPRDYYVQLHGTKGLRDKLSHAGIYGMDMCVQTMYDLYGVEANYNALINFNTIVELVDSIGGINVNNPKTFTLWGQTYKEGVIWLNGDMALLFSRARKTVEGGDIGRQSNQQLVIEAILARVTEPKVALGYQYILKAIEPHFRSNIPPTVITQLFSRQISLGGDWSVEKMVALGTPAEKPTYSMGEQELDVVIPDERSLQEIRNAIYDFMHPSN